MWERLNEKKTNSTAKECWQDYIDQNGLLTFGGQIMPITHMKMPRFLIMPSVNTPNLIAL